MAEGHVIDEELTHWVGWQGTNGHIVDREGGGGEGKGRGGRFNAGSDMREGGKGGRRGGGGGIRYGRGRRTGEGGGGCCHWCGSCILELEIIGSRDVSKLL
jgi:hypothetical protein